MSDTGDIRDQLALDEGERFVVYTDSLGYPTVGIGHLVTPEDKLRVGDRITKAQVQELFSRDLDSAIASATAIFPDLQSHPLAVRDVIINMVFNLGRGGLSGFHRFIAAVKRRDYRDAAHEMEHSLWHNQHKERSKRLEEKMRSAAV
jgi:lysozyme